MSTTAIAVSGVPIDIRVNGSQVKESVCIGPAHTVRIPAWVNDLASFRRWVHSGKYPEKVRICYLNGELWVDLSMEDFFAHNQVKGEYGRVLGNLSKVSRRGRFVPDGMLVTNARADLSCEPDGMFILHETFESGRIKLVEGKKGKQIELEGTPDTVLEVVSDSSVGKDYGILRRLYWEAGVKEFWLVDVRGDRMTFDILRHSAKDFVAVRKQNGWMKSSVFGKSFRLTRTTDEHGHPEFNLEMK